MLFERDGVLGDTSLVLPAECPRGGGSQDVVGLRGVAEGEAHVCCIWAPRLTGTPTRSDSVWGIKYVEGAPAGNTPSGKLEFAVRHAEG